MSTVSKPSAAFVVVERFRQDECKLSFLFYTDLTPTNQDGIEFEFTLSDSTATVLKKVNADITRPLNYKLEVLLTDADKAKLGPKRFTFRLFNKSKQKTVIEGAFAFVKQISRTENGAANPPDILIRYTSAQPTVIEEVLSVVQGIKGDTGTQGPAGSIANANKEVVSVNLFNRNDANFKQNQALLTSADPTQTGNLILFAGYIVSDYFPVTPGEQYTFSNVGTIKALQFADSNKVRLSGANLNTGTTVITIPANCYFILFTIKNSSESTIPATYQLQKGAVATAYEAFKVSIKGLDNTGLTAERLAANALIPTVAADPKAVVNRETALAIAQAVLPVFGQKIGKQLFNRNDANLKQNQALATSSDPTQTGSIIPLAGYVLSDYFPVTPGEQYTFSSVLTLKVVQFADANKVRISGQNLASGATAATTITIPANCYFILFTVKASADATIPASYQLEKGAVATAYEAYQTSVMDVNGKPILASELKDGAKLGQAGAEPTSLVNKQGVQDLIKASIGLKAGPNIFNRNSTQAGKAVDTGGRGDVYIIPNWISSEYLAVLPGEQYTFSGTGIAKGLRFEDAARVKLSGLTLSGSGNTTITVPVNAAWMIFTVKADTETAIPQYFQVEKGLRATAYFQFGGGIVENLNGNGFAPYYHAGTTGKNLLIFGDSIATMWPPYITFPAWGAVNSVATSSAWIKDHVSGVPLTNWSTQVQTAIDQAYPADVIGVFLGTNDSPTADFGTYAEAMAKTTLESLDRTKLFEALRYNYWKITTQWPNAKVFHAIPLQRADRTPDQMKALGDAIRKMAGEYCVKVIEAEIESGIIRHYEVASGVGRYLYDGLHPSNVGRKLLADYYMQRILRHLV